METIALREVTLVQEVQQIAAHEGKDAESIVAEAVRRHLTQYRQKRILAETEAWYRLPAEIRNQYSHQYVGVFDGEIVDSDPDRLRLYARLRERFHHQPVLMIEGGDQPMPVYHVRSPHRA